MNKEPLYSIKRGRKYLQGTVRGNNVKIRGGLGALLVCAIENTNNYDIVDWKAVVVDGERIKADVFYTLKNGELVEVK